LDTLGPSRVADGASKVAIRHEIGYGEVLDDQLAVGLGEMAGDLMKEASACVEDAGVLADKPPGRFGPVVGATLCT
jgi:hypothetical protein